MRGYGGGNLINNTSKVVTTFHMFFIYHYVAEKNCREPYIRKQIFKQSRIKLGYTFEWKFFWFILFFFFRLHKNKNQQVELNFQKLQTLSWGLILSCKEIKKIVVFEMDTLNRNTNGSIKLIFYPKFGGKRRKFGACAEFSESCVIYDCKNIFFQEYPYGGVLDVQHFVVTS